MYKDEWEQIVFPKDVKEIVMTDIEKKRMELRMKYYFDMAKSIQFIKKPIKNKK